MTELYARIHGPELAERGLFDGVHSLFPRGAERLRINRAMERLIETLRAKAVFAKAVRALEQRSLRRLLR